MARVAVQQRGGGDVRDGARRNGSFCAELIFQRGVDGAVRRAVLSHARDEVAAARATCNVFARHGGGGGAARAPWVRNAAAKPAFYSAWHSFSGRFLLR